MQNVEATYFDENGKRTDAAHAVEGHIRGEDENGEFIEVLTVAYQPEYGE